MKTWVVDCQSPENHLDLFSFLIFSSFASFSTSCMFCPRGKTVCLLNYSSLVFMHLLHYSWGHSTLNHATASSLFTAVCPPELSSVWINTWHNAVQEQKIIILFIMQKGPSTAKTTGCWFMTVSRCFSHHCYEQGRGSQGAALSWISAVWIIVTPESPDWAECSCCASVSACCCLNEELCKRNIRKNTKGNK